MKYETKQWRRGDGLARLTNTSLSSCSETRETISTQLSSEAGVLFGAEVLGKQYFLKLLQVVNLESSTVFHPGHNVIQSFVFNKFQKKEEALRETRSII